MRVIAVFCTKFVILYLRVCPAVFGIYNIFKGIRIRILESVHWITNPAPDPAADPASEPASDPDP
jgi:hypothetical protein